jgi:signal transduction histidine kinase
MARILLLMDHGVDRVKVVTALRDAGQSPIDPAPGWDAPGRLVQAVERAAPDVVIIGCQADLDAACARCELLMEGEHTRYVPTLIALPRHPTEVEAIRIFAAGARDLVSLADPMNLVSARIDNMARLNYLRRTFRKHHDALTARNEELDRIFETVTTGLAIVDERGRIVRMNARGREILGPHVGAFGLDDAREHPIHRAALKGESVRGQRVELAAARTGGERVLIVDAEPLFGEYGQRLGGLVVFRDETDAIRMQETLRGKAQELAQRTEEMEAFVYTASHDMKSPLWTIRRYAAMIIEDQGEVIGDEARHFLERIEVNAARLGRLVEDLVRVVKVGKMELFLEPIPVDRPAREALRNLDAAVRQSGAVVDLPTGLPAVLADPDRLVDLFENLLGNAIKYRRSEAPCRISVRAELEGEHVHIQVQDNGLGIPSDQFERIFGLFQRLHTRDQIEGSGLGLAIVQRVVERHGGRIWVASTLGEGSTFHVVLPAAGEGLPPA